jgi:hypothetical protein
MADSSGMDGLGPMLMSMATKGNNMDGGFGGGGGLIGGLVLGSLLGRNGGGLFGNNGTDGAIGGAVLRNPPEQNQANMDLMQSIGMVDKAVAVNTAAMEASQAAQSAQIVAQFNSVTGSLANRIDGTKDAVNANAVALMQMINQTNTNISNDGEKTRALITSNYQDTLNRQLAEANAAIIELRGDNRSQRHARDNEINMTQTVNQAQSQQQQQSQFDRLYHMMSDAAQNIKATNQAINFGSGTLTANPTNTNTNNRVS